MCLGEEETQMNHIICILFVLGAIVQNSRRIGEKKTKNFRMLRGYLVIIC